MEVEERASYLVELHAGLKPTSHFCWDPMLGAKLFFFFDLHPLVLPSTVFLK